MAVRIYICPWVGSGTHEDPYRSKAQTYFAAVKNYFPSKIDGTPASPWVLSVVRSDDFSPIEADSTCDDLFAGDLPSNIENKSDLLNFLRARTVGDIPVSRRSAILAVLDEYGVVRSDFNLATPLWRVVRRVISTLFEQDDNFGAGGL